MAEFSRLEQMGDPPQEIDDEVPAFRVDPASIFRTGLTFGRIRQPPSSYGLQLDEALIAVPSPSGGDEMRVTTQLNAQNVKRSNDDAVTSHAAAQVEEDGTGELLEPVRGAVVAGKKSNGRPIGLESPPNNHRKRALELRKRSVEDDAFTPAVRLDKATSRAKHWRTLLRDENAPADQREYWQARLDEETLEIEECQKLVKKLKKIRSQGVETNTFASKEQQKHDAEVRAGKSELKRGRNTQYYFDQKVKSGQGTPKQQEDWKFGRDLAETHIARAQARLKELARSDPNLGPADIRQRMKMTQKRINKFYRQIRSGGTPDQIQEWTTERETLISYLAEDKSRLEEMTKELAPKISELAGPKVTDHPTVVELQRLLLKARRQESSLLKKIKSRAGTPEQIAGWEEQHPRSLANVQTYEKIMVELKTVVKKLDVAQRKGDPTEIEHFQGKLRELEATIASRKKASDAPPTAAEMGSRERLEAHLASHQRRIQSMDGRAWGGREEDAPGTDWEAERARLVAEAEGFARELESLRRQGSSNPGEDPSGVAPAGNVESDKPRSKERKKKAEPNRINKESIVAAIDGIQPLVRGAGETIIQGWKGPWPHPNAAVLQPLKEVPRLGRVIIK
ncbi:MAG: hypothetical protein M1823_002620 [Watsoniomyces obsoletus]|nr:MAG: hypothetical protein M1823_002620 [Watsoniomyces obsoletus]